MTKGGSTPFVMIPGWHFKAGNGGKHESLR
jgi:hypothetical protein